MCQQNIAVVVDGLDKDLRLADGEIVEAILAFAIPVNRVVRIGRRLFRQTKLDMPR